MLAIPAACQRCNVSGVPSEHTYSITGGYCPHANGMVRTASEDVGRVGVERNAIHILIVTSKDTLLTDMIGDPETGSSIMTP